LSSVSGFSEGSISPWTDGVEDFGGIAFDSSPSFLDELQRATGKNRNKDKDKECWLVTSQEDRSSASSRPFSRYKRVGSRAGAGRGSGRASEELGRLDSSSSSFPSIVPSPQRLFDRTVTPHSFFNIHPNGKERGQKRAQKTPLKIAFRK
jgi:hypothetical protein